jgi:membrane associated rhomboid family serine protease
MSDTGVIGTLLLIFTGLTTYKGFSDPRFFEENLFEVDGILMDKEYKRLVSSGFLHTSWLHFGFNMIALMSFSWSLEVLFGYWKLLFIYFASLIGGNILALFIHRNHGDYRAVGASGAISGVIFSSIILFPDAPIKFILIPIEFKGWFLGLVFVLVSIFGIKSKRGNIGHEAHLGGAIVGAVITLFLVPFETIQWWVVALLLGPTILFLILIVQNPAVMMVDGYWGEGFRSVKKRVKRKPRQPVFTNKQEELDTLLDKIRLKGMDSLTPAERTRLEELTDEL